MDVRAANRTLLRPACAALVLLAVALAAPTASAMVGGTDQLGDAFASPLAYIEIRTPTGTGSCTGTLISPTVVMTAAHCVYDETKSGGLLGVARPSDVSVRVGSLNVSDPSLGVAAGVVAVLPQPYYRWDGSRHFHDIALLALDRTMPETPARLAEQRPDTGKPLLMAGYGQTSTRDRAPPAALRAGLITAAAPRSCRLTSETFDASWLFCGAAASDPAVPGGTACYGDSGGPAFAFENTVANLVVEGVISYGSQASCEYSRSYLVLVSTERGFIDRALATLPQAWGRLRDDPPRAVVRAVHQRLGRAGSLSLRIDDDHSRHSRVAISFFSRGGKRIARSYRGIPTDRWVQFSLQPAGKRFTGYVCAQGSDGTNKLSNLACAADVVR
jgi:trypsin